MHNAAGEKARQRQLLLFTLIVFLGFLLYSHVLLAPFVFDDSFTIIYNPQVKSFVTSLKDITNNRYIGVLSFAFNYAVGEFDPFKYHLVNVLIHAVNAVLVFFLVKSILPASDGRESESLFIPAFSAFLFVAHPVQTQAVTYISQRFASLATLFYLSSLLSYIMARRIRDERKSLRDVRYIGYYASAMVFACLGMKTKEIAITIPFMLLAYEIVFRKREASFSKNLAYLAPMFLTLLVLPLTKLFFHASPFDAFVSNIDTLTQDERVSYTRIEYLSMQFRVIVAYLRLLVFPVNQNFDYGQLPSGFFSYGEIAASCAVIVMLAIISFLLLRKEKVISFGIVWFFVALSVESSIIPIRDPMVEHRMYLPSVGIFMVVSTLISRIRPGSRIRLAAAVLMVTLLSSLTYARNIVYQSPESLWQDVIAKAPGNSRGYGSLGLIYKTQGMQDQALAMFDKVLALEKGYPEVFLHLGDIYYERKDYQKSLYYLDEGIKIDLTNAIRASALSKKGLAYTRLEETDKAIDAYEEAIKYSVRSIIPFNNLGIIYIRNGEFDKAIEVLQQGLKIRDNPNLYKNLSVAYQKKGEQAKAEEALAKDLMIRQSGPK